MTPTLTDILSGLSGQSCKQIDNPVGSVVRLDLGEMSVTPDLPEGEHPHGWRHLTILSPWRIESEDVVVCDWTDPGGKDGVLSEFIQVLKDRVLLKASCSEPSFDLLLDFAGGYRLVVFNDVAEFRDDSWFILGTDGLRVVAAPKRVNEGGLSLHWRKRQEATDQAE